MSFVLPSMAMLQCLFSFQSQNYLYILQLLMTPLSCIPIQESTFLEECQQLALLPCSFMQRGSTQGKGRGKSSSLEHRDPLFQVLMPARKMGSTVESNLGSTVGSNLGMVEREVTREVHPTLSGLQRPLLQAPWPETCSFSSFLLPTHAT